MTWVEDALIELDMNADKFTPERKMFWEGEGGKRKANHIYAICRNLNGRNLDILYSTAKQLMDRQKEEMKHEQN